MILGKGVLCCNGFFYVLVMVNCCLRCGCDENRLGRWWCIDDDDCLGLNLFRGMSFVIVFLSFEVNM